MSIWGTAAPWGVASGGIAAPQNSAETETNLQSRAASVNPDADSQIEVPESTGEMQNANV